MTLSDLCAQIPRVDADVEHKERASAVEAWFFRIEDILSPLAEVRVGQRRSSFAQL